MIVTRILVSIAWTLFILPVSGALSALYDPDEDPTFIPVLTISWLTGLAAIWTSYFGV